MQHFEENAVHHFPTIWDSFLNFENMSRKRGETLSDFICQWKENMLIVQETGCEYSDTLLACKLLQKVNLTEIDAKNIVNSLAYVKSEMLGSVLFQLENYAPEKSESENKPSVLSKMESNHSKVIKEIKEEMHEELFNNSKPSMVRDLTIVPEVEIKEEVPEVAHVMLNVDLTELVENVEFKIKKKTSTRKKRGPYKKTKKTAVAREQENDAELDDFESLDDNQFKTEEDIGPKPKRKKVVKSQCELCGKNVCVTYLDQHHITCLIRMQSQGNSSTMKSEERKKIERLQCEHCGKDFSRRGHLKEHYLRCPNLEQEERDAKGYACPSNRSVSCKICGKSFARLHNYKLHLSLHTGEKNFKCDICPAAFTHPSLLDFHKYRHEVGKRHQCHVCQKSFHATTGLKRHIMRFHTKERPFQCPHCNYNTVDKSHLARHIRTHTGETPYKCSLCGKHYKDRNSVKRHLKAHHGYCDKDNIVKSDDPIIKSTES